MDKETLRSEIFRHLDGVVTAPIVASLIKKEIIAFIIERQKMSLSELSEEFKANEGYLNVAIRALASQDFLDYMVDNETDRITFSANGKTQFLQKYSLLYLKVISFLKHSTDIKNQINENSFIEEFTQLSDSVKDHFGIQLSDNNEEKEIQKQILKHIEGCIIGPVIVYLGMTGMFS
ncbi:hypothetical protein [Chryseobacterium indoltheticum]|uniref:hypothetical protein n=1 Tax=Chryseobacterium indoltheticum TaxID=254 RepID=UPI003F493BC2